MARKHRDLMRLLAAEIVSGALAPREMLPREVDLTARFDVSRGVARETIRALEERGLVTVRHGRGASVNDADAWDYFDTDVLAALLDTEQGGDILTDYLECRRILEVEAAGAAARQADPEHLRDLEKALEAMEVSANRAPGRSTEELFAEADVAFHEALIAATGNRALGALLHRIRFALVLARLPLARPEYRVQRALPEHRRIYEAVARGDAAEAQQAMTDHLDTISRYLAEMRAERSAGQARSNGDLRGWSSID